MSQKTYISVILPLKLEWEPCYWVSGKYSRGDAVRVNFAGREYTAVVSAVGIEPQTAPSEIRGIIGPDRNFRRVSEETLRFWQAVADYYLCTIGEVFKAAQLSPAGDMTEEKADSDGPTSGKKAKATQEVETIELSDAQKEAERQVREAFAAGKPCLLNGVTGSGKTAIYTDLALKTLKQGRNVLCLVPEIAMSRQLEGRLRKYFGDRLLSYHSGMTAARRRKSLEALGGEARAGGFGARDGAHKEARDRAPYILLGTRSALFLPHHDLGLIIVDEEHDNSYKQESPAPRYNARDSAIMLARVMGADTLLGSATPSLESVLNCRNGKFTEVSLTTRYHEAGESEVEIIDTVAERRKRGMAGSFSRKLILRIEQALERGGQVMILRARRGYSPVIQCVDCGFIPKCPHCNVSLTFHKDNSRIRCHHCGYSMKYPEKCPECSGEYKALGAGTQKIEEEAAALFPSAVIARLDSDNTQSVKYEKEVIRSFEEGRTDILIGTQIVTKGFDFSNLNLVAVMQADSLMGMQDFRADEKALQVLEQFRGRCGRRGRKGLFMIQTSQPSHPVYQRFIKGAQAEDSVERLLQERQDFDYPPFTRAISISISDRYEERAEKVAAELADTLSRRLCTQEAGGCTLMGPYAPASGKLADMHIREIRLILKKDRMLAERKRTILKTVRQFEAAQHHSHIGIDVDPL